MAVLAMLSKLCGRFFDEFSCLNFTSCDGATQTRLWMGIGAKPPRFSFPRWRPSLASLASRRRAGEAGGGDIGAHTASAIGSAGSFTVLTGENYILPSLLMHNPLCLDSIRPTSVQFLHSIALSETHESICPLVFLSPVDFDVGAAQGTLSLGSSEESWRSDALYRGSSNAEITPEVAHDLPRQVDSYVETRKLDLGPSGIGGYDFLSTSQLANPTVCSEIWPVSPSFSASLSASLSRFRSKVGVGWRRCCETHHMLP